MGRKTKRKVTRRGRSVPSQELGIGNNLPNVKGVCLGWAYATGACSMAKEWIAEQDSDDFYTGEFWFNLVSRKEEWAFWTADSLDWSLPDFHGRGTILNWLLRKMPWPKVYKRIREQYRDMLMEGGL